MSASSTSTYQIMKGNESLPQTLTFLSLYLETKWRRLYIFQTMNYVRSNNLSLKYLRSTHELVCKGIEIIKSESVARTRYF